MIDEFSASEPCISPGFFDQPADAGGATPGGVMSGRQGNPSGFSCRVGSSDLLDKVRGTAEMLPERSLGQKFILYMVAPGQVIDRLCETTEEKELSRSCQAAVAAHCCQIAFSWVGLVAL